MQIISEMNDMGYSFSPVDSQWIKCQSPCVPQLQSAAADDLKNAAVAKNDYITLNSAVRSSAQQYLLYMWYLDSNSCGNSLAAKPGTSNHEGGRAIDTSYYSYWLDTLASFGWIHSYPDTDPVHFDYLAAKDLASVNLQAFQRLYNRNTQSAIAEDGIYGTDSQNAFNKSPCGGW
jgi:LAS superfamily LD-carboxypeptidase LdcB